MGLTYIDKDVVGLSALQNVRDVLTISLRRFRPLYNTGVVRRKDFRAFDGWRWGFRSTTFHYGGRRAISRFVDSVDAEEVRCVFFHLVELVVRQGTAVHILKPKHKHILLCMTDKSTKLRIQELFDVHVLLVEGHFQDILHFHRAFHHTTPLHLDVIVTDRDHFNYGCVRCHWLRFHLQKR